MAFYWPIRWLAYGRPTVGTPCDDAMAVLLLMAGATVFISVWPELTFPQVYRLLVGIGLFYAVVNWATSRLRLRIVLAGALCAGLLLALSAPFSTAGRIGTLYDSLPFTAEPWYGRLLVMMVGTSNENVVAGALVLVLPPALALLLFAPKQLGWLGSVLALVSAMAMGAILALTASRGAFVALAAVLIVLLLLRWPWSRHLVPTVMLASALVGYVLYRRGMLGRLILLAMPVSDNGRIELWSRAIYMIEDFSLTGIGMGGYENLSDLMYPLFLVPTNHHAHNLFLQVGVDLGLPGLIAWSAIGLLVTLRAWQVYQYGHAVRDGWIAGVGAAMLGSQVALVVHGLTDAVAWGMVRTAVIPWALWGLTMASWNVLVGFAPFPNAGRAGDPHKKAANLELLAYSLGSRISGPEHTVVAVRSRADVLILSCGRTYLPRLKDIRDIRMVLFDRRRHVAIGMAQDT
jgi:putative inorganic carbon (HCO3(-)) transporter